MVEISFFDGYEVVQDILAMILTIVAIQILISINDQIKKRELLSTTVTRKFIHIFAAPIYLFMWPLYSGMWFSPYIAMIVPLLFAAQFSLIGFGIIKNEPFVNSMSRSGDPRELLRGTLYYAIIMIIAALFFFVTLPLSDDYGPVAIVTLMILAFGDGFADIVGRTMDKMTFTVFSKKSVPGTIAMLIASLIGAFLGLIIFGFDLGELGLITVIACLVATIVEVASPRETDNITIPVAVILTFFILTPILLPDVTWELFKVHTP